MLYLVLTEDRPDYRRNIINIVGRWFPGSTLLLGKGAYTGKLAPCLVVEIDASLTESVDLKISDVIQEIRRQNQRQTILFDRLHCESEQPL